jgi:hypothetical protein
VLNGTLQTTVAWMSLQGVAAHGPSLGRGPWPIAGERLRPRATVGHLACCLARWELKILAALKE